MVMNTLAILADLSSLHSLIDATGTVGYVVETVQEYYLFTDSVP